MRRTGIQSQEDIPSSLSLHFGWLTPVYGLQEEADEAYRDQARWTRMSIMSTAGSGYFSSDRTIRQYAEVRRKQISDDLVP